MNGAPCELAMADFTTAGRTHTAGFTDAVGREVVMQQEVFLVGAFQRVDELFVIGGAERGHNQRLCFTAGEQGRTMGAGQNADFGDNRTHGFDIAAIDTDTGVQNVRRP